MESQTVEDIKDKFSKFKENILKIMTKKNEMIEILSFSNKNLEETNRELKSKILIHEEENNKKRFCIHCHQNFIPKFNEEVKN